MDLTKFFYPKDIVLLGVSLSPGNLGINILENLERFGFKGSIYLVSNKYKEIRGRKTYPHVAELETTPDLAVLLIPAKAIPEVLDACGEKGIRQIVIESGGFSEFAQDRRELESEILHIASKWGITIMGPNCIGTINLDNGLVLPFVPLSPAETKKGELCFISQSGGIMHDLMINAFYEGIGMSKLVSMGNKLMIDENDLLQYFIDDVSTQVIGLYLEDFSNGRKFMELVSETSKPVMVLKSNITPQSSEIAQFHTSSLAGDYKVVQTAMKQCGAVQVKNIEELIYGAKIFGLPELKGSKLAFITRSGGHAVMCADSAYRHGFELARLSDDFFDWLSKKPRAGVIRATNPIDLGDMFDVELYFEIAERVVKEPDVDGVVFAHSYPFNEDSTIRLGKRLHDLSVESRKPIIFSVVVARNDFLSLRQAGFPIFSDYDLALELLAKSLIRRKSRDKSPLFRSKTKKNKTFKRSLHSVPPSSRILTPYEAFSFLRAHGLPCAKFEIVKSWEDAITAADKIGYPIVLKTASPDVLHKKDARAVFLDIKDKTELTESLSKLPGPPYLIQSMEDSGCEIIIGGREDDQFGKVILCGIGGTFVELYKDLSLRIVPIDKLQAREMIEELTGKAIILGFRGDAAYDLDTLIDIIVRVSKLLCHYPELKTLDINPLILRKKGQGATIVDGKIEVYEKKHSQFAQLGKENVKN